jgi:4-hydroxy-tetrahydrodipicolinate synthase
MKNLEQRGKFVQSIKYGVTIKGINAGIPRLPLQQLNEIEKKEFENIINTMNNTIKEIG